MNFSADQIAAATGGSRVGADVVGPIATDTRALPDGAWFVALRGERFDAHSVIASGAAAAAAGVVVSRPVPEWTGPYVLVADTTVALQDLGRAARARLTGPVVALTGSSGKTTTRALVTCALSPLASASRPVHQTVGNLNNHLGVPMTLCAAAEDAAVSVVELGTSSPGEIRFLAELATPDVRLVINVGPAHLLELGGLAGVSREKGSLHDTARPGDVCVTSADDPWLKDRPRQVDGVRWITFGTAAEADVRVVDVRVDAASWSTVATYDTPVGRLVATIPAPGTHIALDGAAALAVALGLGVDLAAAAAALASYAPVGMRLRPEPLPNGALAINDAYNANPASMRASLDTLAKFDGRRIAVMGDMLELGTDEAALHADTVAYAASLGLDALVLVGPRMAAAAAAAPGALVSAEAVDVVPALRALVRPGDRILFKGSRGARVERVLDALRDALTPSTAAASEGA